MLNISYSVLFHPQTTLTPNLPPEILLIVVTALAANTGLMKIVCKVENKKIFFVITDNAEIKENISNVSL